MGREQLVKLLAHEYSQLARFIMGRVERAMRKLEGGDEESAYESLASLADLIERVVNGIRRKYGLEASAHSCGS